MLTRTCLLREGRSNAHVKGDYQRIGDVMLRNMCALKVIYWLLIHHQFICACFTLGPNVTHLAPRPQEFTSYLQKHDEVLTELEKASKRVKKLETVYKEFELQKVCYLPLNTFLLKPIQRLMHYKLILERLCKHYSPIHRDHDDCKGELSEVCPSMTLAHVTSAVKCEAKLSMSWSLMLRSDEIIEIFTVSEVLL